MNYVDANILIYSIRDATIKGIKSRELLEKQRVVTSVLSLDEVAYKLLKESRETAVKVISGISTSPNIVLVPFLPEDVDLFKELLEKGLGPRDAIHALTAKKMKCAIMYSEDQDFDKITDFVRKTPW
ncbi:MAG: type II toxin-antitoxin system VapC family toxin [Candidatus Micrarchaeota archaeon]